MSPIGRENNSRPQAETGETSGVERIKALADGVFAVVLTLLVLDLKLPELPAEATQHAKITFEALLNTLGGTFFAYFLSFAVVGVYWYNHVAIMKRIRRTDTTFTILNLAFLLPVTFIPFTANLFPHTDRFDPPNIPIILYSGTLILVGLLDLALWRHATQGRRLVDAELTEGEVRRSVLSVAVPSFVYLISIVVSFINFTYGIYAYFLIPVAITVVITVSESIKGREARLQASKEQG